MCRSFKIFLLSVVFLGFTPFAFAIPQEPSPTEIPDNGCNKRSLEECTSGSCSTGRIGNGKPCVKHTVECCKDYGKHIPKCPLSPCCKDDWENVGEQCSCARGLDNGDAAQWCQEFGGERCRSKFGEDGKWKDYDCTKIAPIGAETGEAAAEF